MEWQVYTCRFFFAGRADLWDRINKLMIKPMSVLTEYSGAAEPPFRKIGNRESGAGNRHTAIVTFASLLA